MDIILNLFQDAFLLFVTLAFIAAVLFLEGLYLAWNAYKGPEAKQIERRLRAMAAGAGGAEASIMKQRLLSNTPGLEQLLQNIPRVQQLDRLLQQSGLTWTVAHFIGLTVLTGIVSFVVTRFLRVPWPITLVVAVATSVIPFLYVLRTRQKRMQTIAEQLPDALDLISRALRAGHAFPAGLQMVGEEMPDPIAGEFRITHDEVNYGVAMQNALVNLATRVPSTDLNYFVIAVLIQRETGGNLTEMLRNLSHLIRERLKLLGKIRVLSAEGRLSAWILSILPFALAAVINVINPDFMSVLWIDPMGNTMISSMLILMAVGILWMRKIIKIHV